MNKRPTKLKNKQTTLMTNKQRKNLTPNCKQLYSQVLKFKRKQDILSKKNLNMKCRLKLAKQFNNSPLRNQLMEKVNSTTLNFILTQIKIQKRKIEGRRYTLNDKITALSIYKTSPKGYKFLSSLFALPSKKTLSNLLHKIKFHAGVNNHIINNLKYQAEKLEQLDKNCTLLFDEMALGTNIMYDKKNDFIFGFDSFGLQASPKIADHVLVFMIRGIRKKYKQPIAYYYCQGTTKTPDLAVCIKEVISAIQTTGLKIRAVVCDQGSTNQAAINSLKEETKRNSLMYNTENKIYNGFLVNGEEIVCIYDPPHLLKCVRNNLLTKNLIFTWKCQKQEATWDDIQTLYTFDKANEVHELRALPKLTEAHVIPEKIKKMRVSIAAQVFSQRVAATMKLMSDYGKYKIIIILMQILKQKYQITFIINKLFHIFFTVPQNTRSTAKGTSNLCLFMDKVFDSVNGSTVNAKDCKPLKCAIKENSPHIDF